MSLYTQAIENVKAAHLKAIQSFMEKNFPEIMLDQDAIKAEFERYFNDSTENAELLEQELITRYGMEEMQKQWARKGKGARRKRNG